VGKSSKEVGRKRTTKIVSKATPKQCRKDGDGKMSHADCARADEVAAATQSLQDETAAHKKTAAELIAVKDDLKNRVMERTEELDRAYRALRDENADRTRAEKIAQAERQRLYDVLETLPVYVVLLSEDYHVPFANRFFRERFGESRGLRCFEYLFNRSEPCENCESYKALKTNAPHYWEWTGPDGRNYDIHDFPFTDADGSRMVMEMGIDITEQKRAQEELEKYRDRLEELVKERTEQLNAAMAEAQLRAAEALEAAETIRLTSMFPKQNPNPVLRIDRDGTILYANPVSGPFLAHWGLAQGQHLPEDWRRRLAEIIDAGKPVEQDVQCGDRIFSCVLAPIAGEGYVNIYGHDITDRRHAEEALRESEERFRALAEALPQIVWTADAEGAVDWFNQRWYEYTGGSTGFGEGWSWDKVAHPDDMPHTLKNWQEALEQGSLFQNEIRTRRHDGQYRWFLVRAWPLRDVHGNVVCWFGTNTDIQDMKTTEEALQRSNEEWERTFNSVPDLIAILDPQHKIVRVNRAMAERLGATVDECPGLTCYRCVHDLDAPPEFCPHAKAIADGREHVEEVHEDRLGGDFIFSCTPLFDQQGKIVGSVHVAHDITERKRAEQVMRNSQQDLNRAQAVAQTGSWRMDVRHNKLLWSDENHRIFGIPKGTALTYEAFLAVVHPDDREYVDQKWNAALRGEPYDVVHRIVVGDAVKWVREKVELEFDEQGLLLGGFGTTQDITLLKQADEELEHAKDVAVAANAAKSQFFANISHDLRTPMNAILGMTELALEEVTDPAIKDYLETAKESAYILLELLNEVLDLSRMEAGKILLESKPFGLRETLDQTLKILRTRTEEKGLELVCNVLDDIPNYLIGDPRRFTQILMNLAGNAIKFTAHGKVAVSVRVQGSGFGVQKFNRERAPTESCSASAVNGNQKEVVLEFAVEDTGIGISPEDQARIFAPFTQASAATSRTYGGTGLGLSIASNLVEMMGGKIWLESKPGEGSKFYFTVRLGIQSADSIPPQPATAEPSTTSEPQSAVQPLRILLAEDNPANQKVALYILNKYGHTVKVACNGREALELLGKDDFDIVLMDVHMSIMDGFQATAAIRKLTDPAKARIPIVAMTASAMTGDQERCLEAGMDGYISKPMNIKELLILIEQFSHKSQSRLAVADVPLPARGDSATVTPTPATARGDAANNVPTPSTSPAQLFNLDDAVARCFGKYEIFQDMVDFLFVESDQLLEKMRTALDQKNAVELGNAAHRLKGTVVFLCAPAALDATQSVERIGLSGELSGAEEAIDRLQLQLQLLTEAVVSHRKSGK
jgi:PAS domain S-box-containing protein